MRLVDLINRVVRGNIGVQYGKCASQNMISRAVDAGVTIGVL
jgi:hypothetical protein